LTDEEKTEILDSPSIIINNYDVELDNCTTIYERIFEIYNKETFTNSEIFEIYNRMYNSESIQYHKLEDDILYENGWNIENTIYGFYGKCILTPIDE
jgi:hypothetical protein